MTYLTTNFEANKLKDHYEFKFAPTVFTLNAANVRLMDYFNWKRVAIVYDFLETGGLYVKVWPNINEASANKPNKNSSYIKVHLTPKYFFAQINLCTCLKRIAPFCPFLTRILTFYRLLKLRNLAIICCTTEQVRGMDVTD